MPTQERTLKQSHSSGSSPMMDCAVPKHQRALDEMMGGAGPVTKEVSVRKIDQFMELVGVTEPALSSELCPQVLEVIRKVRKAMYSIRSFHNVDFRELVVEQ